MSVRIAPPPMLRGTMPRHIFVVSRAHRELFEYLSQQFADDKNVKVILDRRVGERRLEATRREEGERRARSNRRTRPSVDEELRFRSHSVITLPD